MLLNVAAHNVSIKMVKVSKCERHITYSVTKCTASQNIKCTLHKHYKTFVTVYICDAVPFVTFTFWKLYILELLRCVELCFVTLRHVTSMLCSFTLCSNIAKFSTIWDETDYSAELWIVLKISKECYVQLLCSILVPILSALPSSCSALETFHSRHVPPCFTVWTIPFSLSSDWQR
jgi:hypothetical protein